MVSSAATWPLALKRLIDVAGSVSLLVVFAPLLVAIALVLPITQGWPLIHREERLGRGGKPFTLYKFRSLQEEYSRGGSIAPEGDPRITPLGQLLRRWRLDEFPQLFNVLRGDMSLVGPRPLPRGHADTLPADTLDNLLTARPGLSSPATLAFLADDAVLRGEGDAEARYLAVLLPAKARLELDYLAQWSLAADLRILLSTLPRLWSRRDRQRSAQRMRELLDDKP